MWLAKIPRNQNKNTLITTSGTIGILRASQNNAKTKQNNKQYKNIVLHKTKQWGKHNKTKKQVKKQQENKHNKTNNKEQFNKTTQKSNK